jgi:hypothetical protein
LAASPFGKESRVRILRQHFAVAGEVTPATAWQFVYRELLWIDGSTGLAHLYESDKAQPGRTWYDRTVAFTDMLCARFGNISREQLKQELDQLFRACLNELLASQAATAEARELVAALVMEPEQRDLLEPAAEVLEAIADVEPAAHVPDADLVGQFTALLAQRTPLATPEVEALARDLVAKARFYYTVERKRQNVLGEGFEDLLHLLLTRVANVPDAAIRVRKKADQLPGFATSVARRIESPDIAIVQGERTAVLASVKWSLRHDRQKQLSDELDCYVSLLSQPQFPQYVLVTNEYDPGRLVNVVERLQSGGHHVDRVYHMNLELLLGALGRHAGVRDLQGLVDDGRLRSLEDLLREFGTAYGGTPAILQ